MQIDRTSPRISQSSQAFTPSSSTSATGSSQPVRAESARANFTSVSDGFEGATAARGPQLSALSAPALGASVEDTARSLVQDSYRQVLMREGDPDGVRTWQNKAADLLRQGFPAELARQVIDNDLRASDEFQVLSTVQSAFQEVLGRTPDARGYWHQQAETWRAQGASVEDIRSQLDTAFRGSDEYQLNHLPELIGNVYQSELRRPVDPDGLAHFQAKAEQMKAQGRMPAEIKQAIVAEIHQSPEYQKLNGANRWDSKLPMINQLAPSGNDGSYWNGDSNCGPTSMAMVARAVGYGNHLTDAQLVMEMYRLCGTQGSNGTGVDGIRQGALNIGLDAATYRSSAGVEKMAEELRNGRMVVANGDYYALPAPGRINNANGGHYVVVTGMDDQGNFKVNDPAGGVRMTLTPAQMAQFMRENPNGGYFTSMGPR